MSRFYARWEEWDKTSELMRSINSEVLKQRIQNFPYSRTDTNKPPVLKKHPTKQKLKLKCSASDMSCLVRYLGVMIDDFIPHDDHWKMFILLRKIYDILLSPRFSLCHPEELKTFIRNLNFLYLKLNGKLKPKFHFLTNYPAIMELFGPSCEFDMRRFEWRQRQVKANFLATSCRVTLMKTIALKQMCQLCAMVNKFKIKKGIPFTSKDRSIFKILSSFLFYSRTISVWEKGYSS